MYSYYTPGIHNPRTYTMTIHAAYPSVSMERVAKKRTSTRKSHGDEEISQGYTRCTHQHRAAAGFVWCSFVLLHE